MTNVYHFNVSNCLHKGIAMSSATDTP